jgi:hypothetical protein
MINEILQEAKSQADFAATMFKMSPYWPDYIIVERDALKNKLRATAEYVASAKLRKQHEGVWYVVHIMEFHFIHLDSPNKPPKTEILILLGKRIADSAYKFTLFGSINPTLKNHRGELVFPVDTLQITEEKRLNL